MTKAIIIALIKKATALKKYVPMLLAGAIGFLLIHYVLKLAPQTPEKAAPQETISEKAVVAEKTIVPEIKRNPALKKANSLKNSTQTRQIEIGQTTPGGETVDTTVGIFKDKKGQKKL